MKIIFRNRSRGSALHRFYGLPILAMALNLSAAMADESVVAPGLTRAGEYHEGIALADYWVSEKYDGVRAYWDGHKLVSKKGNPYYAPAWFTQNFPSLPMDGELWLGRGRFQALVGIVRDRRPDDEAWHQVKYMIFDLPGMDAPFNDRLAWLSRKVGGAGIPWLVAVPQFKVQDGRALFARLKQVVDAGGEGLMLHRGAALYHSRRNDDLLKLKPYQDAEATVVAHVPGKGRFSGMLGALEVEDAAGRRFRLGTGFSDAERKNPPPVGALVTYRYHGLTDSGLPRFASFMRIRTTD